MVEVIFSRKMIEKIVKGEKTQTRRLVKEGEFYSKQNVCIDSWRSKWRVGKDYAVQAGRGKNGLFYKKNKKGEIDIVDLDCFFADYYHEKGIYLSAKEAHDFVANLKPLRIRITKIEKQKLLDIMEKEARLEGFVDKRLFLLYFLGLYADKISADLYYRTYLHFKLLYNTESADNVELYHKTGEWEDSVWNPEVWVLSFKV